MTEAVSYRPVPGCSKYRVGSDGSIWRWLPGSAKNPPRWKPLKTNLRRWGRRSISIRTDDGLMVTHSVAVLVLQVFVGPRPLGCIPFHFPDPDRGNCRLENLRWSPRGSHLFGKSWRWNPEKESSRRKLTPAQAREIVRLRAVGWTLDELAEEYGIAPETIDQILVGKTYRAATAADRPSSYPDLGRGRRHPFAKLREEDIPEIRRLDDEGRSLVEIAARYGVSPHTIGGICRGEAWKHISVGPAPTNVDRRIGSRNRKAKLREEDIPEIRRLRDEGRSLAQIGALYGIDKSMVHRIVTGRRWKHVPPKS